MTLRFQSTLLIFTLMIVTFVLTDVSAALGGRKEDPGPGPWVPISNVSSAGVQEVAQFAVSEHNKEANTDLTLQNVVSGERQIVKGINYKLIIVAADGSGASGNYETVVLDIPWEHRKILTSFTKL